MKQPSYVGFKSKEYHWKPDIDYRENPHLYKVGRGQQGVLICQPYKSELHIHWRFRTPEEAQKSAQTCLLYTSPSPRDLSTSRMPSSA